MQRSHTVTWLILGWILYCLALLSNYLLLAPGRTALFLIAALAGPVLVYGTFCFAKNWKVFGYTANQFLLATTVGTVLAVGSFWFQLQYSHSGFTYAVHGLPFALVVFGYQDSLSYGWHLISIPANFAFYFLVPHILLHHFARRPSAA
jgi:hypothetical protein